MKKRITPILKNFLIINLIIASIVAIFVAESENLSVLLPTSIWLCIAMIGILYLSDEEIEERKTQ